MDSTPKEAKDLVEHFNKPAKNYTGPRPASGIGIANHEPRPHWKKTFTQYLVSTLSIRHSVRWGMSWGGAPVEELNNFIRSLSERGIIQIQRHAPPGGIVFWTLNRGLNWNPDVLEKEAANA